MKTLKTILLLAVFCLFSSRTFGQKGSIEKLLEKNDFEWQESALAHPDDFDKENELGEGVEMMRLAYGRGKQATTTDIVLNSIKQLHFTPANLKEALQFRDTRNELYAGMYYGKKTVFLGSSIRIGTKVYYPILHWQEKTKKGVITMTDDPFCCEDVNIVVKR